MSAFDERRTRQPVDADGPDFSWLYSGTAPAKSPGCTKDCGCWSELSRWWSS